jgi:hypothetical protein
MDPEKRGTKAIDVWGCEREVSGVSVVFRCSVGCHDADDDAVPPVIGFLKRRSFVVTYGFKAGTRLRLCFIFGLDEL